jgi:hypothetical protein
VPENAFNNTVIIDECDDAHDAAAASALERIDLFFAGEIENGATVDDLYPKCSLGFILVGIYLTGVVA